MLVSVIIVTWNSERFIEKCLSSLFAQRYPHIEVIVVDNGSQDSTLRVMRERFPSVMLIENRENIGFCRANNEGLKKARGEFVLFINSDVILEKDFLERALKGFDKGPRVGMISGKILRFGGAIIDSAGQFLARSRRTIERGYGMPDDGRFDREGSIFSVCGAAALYRRKMIDEVSYAHGEFFDEDFFAFHEDIDIGWRANLLGWRGYYIPDARVQHFRGGSKRDSLRNWHFQISGRPSLIKYHIVKNRYLSIIKNDTLKDYLKDLPFILTRDLLLFFYLLFTAPGALVSLFRNRDLFRRAFRKRTQGERRLEPA